MDHHLSPNRELSILTIDCASPARHSLGIHISPLLTLFFPPSLTPTALQCFIPHFPYLDLLPFATMRDRLLQAGPSVDPFEFWEDFQGGEWRVWGSVSWDAGGWEVGERWAGKWGWLLDGEMVRTTNFWRRERMVGPLVVAGFGSGLLGGFEESLVEEVVRWDDRSNETYS
jgi:hypothetical protein